MSTMNAPPKEGDLYKVVTVEDHTFELYFGFYEEFERKNGEPVVIYPDLTNNKIYTKDGRRIVTAIQEPCENYSVPDCKARDECCNDCEYYQYLGREIGTCICPLTEMKHPPQESTGE